MKTALCFLGLLLTGCVSDADKLPLGAVAVLVAALTIGMVVFAREKPSKCTSTRTADRTTD